MFFIKNFSRTKAGRDDSPPPPPPYSDNSNKSCDPHTPMEQRDILNCHHTWGNPWGFLARDVLLPPIYGLGGEAGERVRGQARPGRLPVWQVLFLAAPLGAGVSLSGGRGWGRGRRATLHLPPDPSRKAGARAHGGRGGSRRPGAGGSPLPARGPPRREAEEDARRPRKLCPSPQGSSPRTCSPVCPIPARGVGRGEGRGVRDAEEERREKRGGAARAPPPPPPRALRAGAVAATAGRGRQHGGVSGGVGASQQQRRRWQRPELRPPAEGGGPCEARRGSIPAGGRVRWQRAVELGEESAEGIWEERSERRAPRRRPVSGAGGDGCGRLGEDPRGDLRGDPPRRSVEAPLTAAGPGWGADGSGPRRRGAGGCWGCEAPAGGRGPRRG